MGRRYWGVTCKSCAEKIVFGADPHARYSDMPFFKRSGHFRCLDGHNHPYDPSDFFVFPLNNEPVEDEAIQRNRDAYVLIGS
jgi:hypothetical protein